MDTDSPAKSKYADMEAMKQDIKHKLAPFEEIDPFSGHLLAIRKQSGTRRF